MGETERDRLVLLRLSLKCGQSVYEWQCVRVCVCGYEKEIFMCVIICVDYTPTSGACMHIL